MSQVLNERGNPTIVNSLTTELTGRIKMCEEKSRDYEKTGNLRSAMDYAKEAAKLSKDRIYLARLQEEKALVNEHVISKDTYNHMSEADKMLVKMRSKDGNLYEFLQYAVQGAGFLFWISKE